MNTENTEQNTQRITTKQAIGHIRNLYINDKICALAEIVGMDTDEYATDEDDIEKRYNEMLDECYEEVPGLGLYSKLLKDSSPTTYRCGFVDWIDSEGYAEINGENFDESALDDLMEAIADAVQELA